MREGLKKRSSGATVPNDRHRFKEKVSKSIANMCNIWQTSADVSKKVTFGKQQQRRRTGEAQRTRSRGSQKSLQFYKQN